MNFQDILDRHNYPSDFSIFLEKVYKNMIDYFGVEMEPIIYEAFLNTKFVFNRNVYDVLREEAMLEVNDIVTEKDLKRASGVCQAVPELIYDQGEFHIKSIKRVVVVSSFNLDKSYSIATFIHELGHLIKSYHKGFEIIGDILIVRSGLEIEKYRLENDNGVVRKHLISKENTGLEEGLNTCFEEEFMQKYFDQNYAAKGYTGVKFVCDILLDRFSLKNAVLNVELSKDYRELIASIGEENFYELTALLDKIYKLDLAIYASMFNPEEIKTYALEREKLINEDFLALYNKIKKDRNRGA